MCRWAAYRGTPVPLELIVSAPGHSLIEQSHCATEAKTATNGDGFGIAWYGDHPEPGLYRDVLPAWSDCNLRSLARQIRSPLFLAHVRASTGGATSRDNCHPFVQGRWSFMHNGQVAGFDKMRRALENRLSDHLFERRAGTTDSELLFLLALEFGLESDPAAAFREAIRFTLEQAARAGLSQLVRFTAAFSDGETLYAIRYATDAHAPSLYAAPFVRSGSAAGGHCLVSEPFRDPATQWGEIPPGTFVKLGAEGLTSTAFAPGEAMALAMTA
ncbi:class II glutamine amidotransferase [Pseudohoeflea coraliihabitans]|uniref:Class II glutamine amidotransferase n=1 Tax=Pseudohoeflea coraliihabitans TaxID=2860393 RepID=A0ABS6WPQ9_9HYPH|nr:class II glutamine amidotransferase [Pseudohoeflea sp. DP4N28-3]MBW3097623.1 class II glutamine amidotransferase [Pseudohoeflea sp. DP4N28-3]